MNLTIIIGLTLLVVILIGMIIWLYKFSKRVERDLEDIAATQFDAVQVMQLYQMKYTRPVVIQGVGDVKELTDVIRVPWEVFKENEDNMDEFIKKDIAKQYPNLIAPYIEIVSSNDYVRNERVYTSRLRVVSKGE